MRIYVLTEARKFVSSVGSCFLRRIRDVECALLRQKRFSIFIFARAVLVCEVNGKICWQPVSNDLVNGAVSNQLNRDFLVGVSSL